MIKFNNISISAKLSLIPIIGLVGFIGYFVYNWTVVSANNERLSEIADLTIPVLMLSRDNVTRIDQLSQVFSAVEESGDDENLVLADTHTTSIESALTKISDLLPGQRNDLQNLSRLVLNYSQTSKDRLAGIMTMTLDMDRAEQMNIQLSVEFKQIKIQLEKISEKYAALLDQQLLFSQESGNSSLQIGLITGIAILTLVTIASLTLIKATVGSIKRVTNSLKAIAEGEGDLSHQIRKDGDDELGELVNWFNQFVMKLQGNINSIIEYTQELTLVSNSLHQSSNNSSGRVQHQLNAVIDVSGAQQQMSTSIHQVGKTAIESSELAEQTNNRAQSASIVMAESKVTIDTLSSELEQSSDVIVKLREDILNINQILDTIKQISDQTNLLALNAAIEAARAGEQGRGFAVVADEVRALASRTQKSTVEIQSVTQELTIAAQNAVDAMSVGKKQADETAIQAASVETILEEISQDISKILSLNNQVAAATNDQDENGQVIQNSINGVQNTAEKGVEGASNLEKISKQLANISNRMGMVTDTFRT